jgi:hypothetical protein
MHGSRVVSGPPTGLTGNREVEPATRPVATIGSNIEQLSKLTIEIEEALMDLSAALTPVLAPGEGASQVPCKGSARSGLSGEIERISARAANILDQVRAIRAALDL